MLRLFNNDILRCISLLEWSQKPINKIVMIYTSEWGVHPYAVKVYVGVPKKVFWDRDTFLRHLISTIIIQTLLSSMALGPKKMTYFCLMKSWVFSQEKVEICNFLWDKI